MISNWGKLLFFTTPCDLVARASRHHLAPTTHHPHTDLSTTAVQQQCNSTCRPTNNGSTQAAVRQYAPQHLEYTRCWVGWGFPLSYDSPSSRGEREPCPGETFHAPRSPSWEPSDVVSRGTRGDDVWCGRGTGLRWLGTGWRTIERATRNEH